MTTTIGSVDLNALSDLYNDANQYFWFESNPDATYGAGVHITLSPDTSFVANPSGQNVLINTDGISIRNGLLPMMTLGNDSLDFNVINTTAGTYNNVASFGSTAIVIGEEAKANMHLTFNNLSMVDKDGTKFFEVGDNRNADGIATVKHSERTSVDNHGEAVVTLHADISSIVSVYVDSVELSSSSYSLYDSIKVIISNLTPNTYVYVEITYTTLNPYFYLTFGKRLPSSEVGMYSVAEGRDVTASGYCSHAEGGSTTASGDYSHAEGSRTTASGNYSHAEGYNVTASGRRSHAEGFHTTASGLDSHAEGLDTTASGDWSHAGGLRTVADGDYMTAIGQYNTKNSGKAFVIGNGTSDTARSDAFAVDWSGNATMKGGLTLGAALSIANGGTGATTPAASRANLGLTGAETKTLLWTNARPNDTFNNQIVGPDQGVDLSGYDSIEIEFKPHKASIDYIVSRHRVGLNSYIFAVTGGINYLYPIMRGFDFYSSGVRFKDVNDWNLDTSNYDICIPTKIYGIKEV